MPRQQADWRLKCCYVLKAWARMYRVLTAPSERKLGSLRATNGSDGFVPGVHTNLDAIFFDLFDRLHCSGDIQEYYTYWFW